MIEHFRVKRWTETDFQIDPIALLHLQFVIMEKERGERRTANVPTAIAIHSNTNISLRTISYIMIDTNRRWLFQKDFVNILHSVDQLSSQIQIFLEKDEENAERFQRMFIIVYFVLLHQSVWTFPRESKSFGEIHRQVSLVIRQAREESLRNHFNKAFKVRWKEKTLKIIAFFSFIFQNFTHNSLKNLREVFPAAVKSPEILRIGADFLFFVDVSFSFVFVFVSIDVVRFSELHSRKSVSYYDRS